jgi:hypothetical protein
MAELPEREELAVEKEELESCEATPGCLDLPKDLEMRMGVSYLTSEKLFDALVVIFAL